MTYITPDDLALRQEMRDPYSVRGVVARAYLRQGNSLDATLPLMPSIPYSPMQLQRRVPSRPVAVARYPFDGGWRDEGMSGLGAVDPVQEELAKLVAKMKTNIIAQTATIAAVVITLQFFPVVGTIISGIFSIVSGLTSAALKREGERMLADFQDEMMRTGAAFQAKVDEASSLAFEEEKPAAIQLALSNATLTGLGTLDGVLSNILSSNVFHTLTNPLRIIKLRLLAPILTPTRLISNAVSNLPVVGHTAEDVGQAAERVETQVDRPIAAVDSAVDTVTGVKGLQDIEQAIANARPRAIAQMQAMVTETIAKINSPAYRSMLRNNIAKAIRNSQPMQAFNEGIIIPDGTAPTTKLSALPMAAAAGGVVLLLVGLGKS